MSRSTPNSLWISLAKFGTHQLSWVIFPHTVGMARMRGTSWLHQVHKTKQSENQVEDTLFMMRNFPWVHDMFLLHYHYDHEPSVSLSFLCVWVSDSLLLFLCRWDLDACRMSLSVLLFCFVSAKPTSSTFAPRAFSSILKYIHILAKAWEGEAWPFYSPKLTLFILPKSLTPRWIL